MKEFPMKNFLLTAALLTSFTLGARAEPTPFVDVPSCHWASTAINGVVAKDVPAVAKNASTAQNALRQVFAGVQCGDADWVSRFVTGAPSALSGVVAQKTLRSFDLRFTRTIVNGPRASLSFEVSVTYSTSSGSVTVRRAGTAALTTNDETGWRVAYTGLAGLNLPFFPR